MKNLFLPRALTHLLLGALVTHALQSQATILVSGDAAFPLPETFTEPVMSKTYDRFTGNLYLGLSTPPSNDAYCLTRIARYQGNINPQAVPIAITAPLSSGFAIPFLAFAASYGKPGNVVGNYSAPGSPQSSLFLCTPSGASPYGTTLPTIAQLLDAQAQPTPSISALTASGSDIFAYVGDPVTTGTSGIAVVAINPTTFALTQTAANPSSSTIQALSLYAGTPQIYINTPPPSPDHLAIQKDLWWDDQLHVLYASMDVIITDTNGGGARSVTVGTLNSNGALTLLDIAPDGAFASGVDNIIGTINASVAGTEVYAAHVRTMHATTGPTYLIVNGDVITPPTATYINPAGETVNFGINNTIYALPIVDNPASPTTHGTLAAIDAPLVNYKFVTPATVNSDLAQGYSTGPVPSPTTPAMVGAGPLPIQSTTLISDINVVGDTVFVSVNDSQSINNESGIFYSQATFDNTGKILNWMPWTKRGIVFNAFASATPNGAVSLFAVDAANGKVWAVDGGLSTTPGGVPGNVVVSTQWDYGNTPTSLPAVLNKTLPNGCFSVLDLDQATSGFVNVPGHGTVYRYALFGGASKVCIALISQAYTTNSLTSPQQVVSDFTLPSTFITTTLPTNAGTVQVLEYSRPSDTALQGYFFAGTQNGLYAFVQPGGNGFNVDTLSTLNAAPFTTGSWQAVPGITGAVIDMKITGPTLYVLTFQTTPEQPFLSQLYAIPVQNPISAMFASNNIYLIAQSRAGVFADAFMFTGIQTLQTGNANGVEQLLLATNQGLFASNASQAGMNLGVADASNQATANWQLLNNTGPQTFTSIAGLDEQYVSPSSTTWPVNSMANTCNTIANSVINQESGNSNADGSAPLFGPFTPADYNSIDSTSGVFTTLNPTVFFSTDGARRFFIQTNPPFKTGKRFLSVLPWDTIAWNIPNQAQQILYDAALTPITNFYWVKEIGISGIVMAGTNTGVVALE